MAGQNDAMPYLPSDAVTRIKAGLDHPVIDSDGHAIEYLPLVRDILQAQAGDDAVAAMDLVTSGGSAVRGLSPEQMRGAGLVRTSWWGLPTRNTLDRGTALLPELLAERLPELGIDHAVLYPTYGLVPAALDDAAIRLPAGARVQHLLRGGVPRPRRRRSRPSGSSRCTRPRRRSRSSTTRPASSG